MEHPDKMQTLLIDKNVTQYKKQYSEKLHATETAVSNNY